MSRSPRSEQHFSPTRALVNPSLQGEVESLIASHEQASGFIEEPAYEVMAGMLVDDHAGSLVGHAREFRRRI